MDQLTQSHRARAGGNLCPPRFRILILFSATVLILALGFLAGGDQRSSAQTSNVDYDLDNDGLIEVSNVNQWRAIGDDLDGNGIVANASAFWHTTGYPNAATAAGCPPRDHDGNQATPDEASCIGYELISDLSVGSQRASATGTYTAKLVGNGFRLLNPTGNSDFWAPVVRTLGWSGTIEGLGVINPTLTVNNNRRDGGGLVSGLQGKVYGVYVEGGNLTGGRVGGIAAIAHNNPGRSVIAHSYVRGTTVGTGGRVRNGGLAGEWGSHNSNGPICVNTFFSGRIEHGGDRGGLITGWNRWNRGVFHNCFGDRTTDTNTAVFGFGAGGGSSRTKAEIIGATGYTGPFANWDDYDANGNGLAGGAPRTDFWDFGDGTTFPVLKAWGHDRSSVLDRQLTGTDTVNLCTRTLAVANEIIGLLKDDTFADGVTGPRPTAVNQLTECTASTDTQEVTVDNLRDFVATTAANPLNLSPGRTDPASDQLTTLSRQDFAYLVNVSHIDLSGNALTSVPPRLFQGLPLLWLDLSRNALVTLPADLFAGLGTIPVTATTGNAIHLNGNALTDTGIPGRIFDTVDHMNGIDLRENALTRINTRWFEQLENLGDKPATATAPVSFLGLGLAGNAINDHYYSDKLFTGIIQNVVEYRGSSASDDLKAAVVAAITAAAGGTTPANLDLDSTDYYVNAGANAGYQPTGTTCPSESTTGHLSDIYLGGVTPDCYILPHWTAGQESGVSVTVPAPTGGAVALVAGDLVVSFSHTASATILRYEIRYRELPDDQDEAWTQEWRRVAISLASGTKTVNLGSVALDKGYQAQVRVVTTAGESEPVTLLLPLDLDPPMELEVVEDSGTLLLSWDSPTEFGVERYEYRTRPAGTEEWSDWTSVDHVGDIGSRQTYRITGVPAGRLLQVELRYIVSSKTSPAGGASGSTRVSVPDVDSIKPEVRELTVRAGDTIRLSVDIYNVQKRLDNDLAEAGLLVFTWSEGSIGGGSFTDPASGRRVTYTAPNLPGRYTVTAEAQPNGICISHHDGDTEITAADRAPCIATFTISVSSPPGQSVSQPDPINPAGVIPSSFSDNEGIAYSVFTPVDGGTFTGEGFTVTARAGAIPDRSLLGVNASVSAVPVPAPVPGASMSVAGVFYDINAITQDGDSPIPSYTLDEPLNACLPYPTEFRAELSNVVVVERKPDGNMGILTSKVRSDAGVLTVCGAVSSLPATVGVAKIGTVPAIPPTPMPEQELPVTGGTAPSATVAVLILLAGVLLLTGIGRIRRMLSV